MFSSKNNYFSWKNNGGLWEVKRLPGSFVIFVSQVFEKLINAEHVHSNMYI